MLANLLNNLWSNYNQKELNKLWPLVQDINDQAQAWQDHSPAQIKKLFADWRAELATQPDRLDQLLVPVFAAVKVACQHLQNHKYEVRHKPEVWQMVPFDVQFLGGVVLHQGKVAEMKTGEGKTLVCTMPVMLNALLGKGVHVITVNDYLAQRDAEWMRPLYEFCGFSVGVVISDLDADQRQEAYRADITYGTNNEFGFDYLRDNMAQKAEQIVQRELCYAIVDEVDSILIDEARTPLIISTAAAESTEKYNQYARLITSLQADEDYTVDIKHKSAQLTENGVKKMEKLLGVDNLFTESGFAEVHHIEQSLKASLIMQRDIDYVVRDNRVIIVDEFTGRLMSGRRFSDGLHQALEAKENLEIQRESKTLATITFQNYFRLYRKLAGMTGTAETEAEEFAKIYKLDTLVIPTHKNITRLDLPDKIFSTQEGKLTNLIDTIKEAHGRQQPILIGTISIEKSELLSQALTKNKLAHEVLNAKQHEREAEIIAKAGAKNSITIATNMAGRGTDIKLGEGVTELGGLLVIGTEKHESRRIDNQLRGRSGRQGDPGQTQFYVSMTDDLMKRFGGEKMSAIVQKMNMTSADIPLENKLFSNAIITAQKKIEGHHFDARKHIVQYDDVMNIHREKMYAKRRSILLAENIHTEIEAAINEASKEFAQEHFSLMHDEVFAGESASLSNVLRDILPIVEPPDNLNQAQAVEELQELIQKHLLAGWEKIQKAITDPDELNEKGRQILLRSIDFLWLKHIDDMTNLRDRVALSGYAQKDPVMEYKAESYQMFTSLLHNIRVAAVTNLFRLEVEPVAAIDNQSTTNNKDQIIAQLENSTTSRSTPSSRIRATDPSQAGLSREAASLGKQYDKVGRNDPCPCGNNKKFKKCHGMAM